MTVSNHLVCAAAEVGFVLGSLSGYTPAPVRQCWYRSKASNWRKSEWGPYRKPEVKSHVSGHKYWRAYQTRLISRPRWVTLPCPGWLVLVGAVSTIALFGIQPTRNSLWSTGSLGLTCLLGGYYFAQQFYFYGLQNKLRGQ